MTILFLWGVCPPKNLKYTHSWEQENKIIFINKNITKKPLKKNTIRDNFNKIEEVDGLI